MGQVLENAVSHVMTPSLAWQDKIALAHVSKYADDCTGEVIDNHGRFRRGCIGLITHIPEDAYERPWWREDKYPLAGRIDSLEQKGWLKRMRGNHELDGAMMLNTSRLVRLMDCEETAWAQDQNFIEWEDEHGNDIDPPCEDFRDPDFLPFIRFADQVHPGDFEYTLLNDVQGPTTRIVEAHLRHDRHRDLRETNPQRWLRAIMDWKDLKTENGFRLPEQWVVVAHDR